MSIQYHKCNQLGCKGYIAFENADFDYKKSINKNEYIIDRPCCSDCNKEFKVAIHHSLIDYDEENCELLDLLPQCSVPSFNGKLTK